MDSLFDMTLREDLIHIANNCTALHELRDCTVLVTGATGLIGSLLVKTLACYNNQYHRNIKILAMVRDIEKAKIIYGAQINRDGIYIVQQDILLPIAVEERVDYLFHCAAITSSKQMISRPVETILTAIDGTKHILDWAVTVGVRSIVYMSSMEVYGRFDSTPLHVNEDMLGYIDTLSVRSDYPESKRMCENICVAYCAEYGMDIKIARLAQCFGAGVLPWETRVFSQFARSAISGENIVLHTNGRSEGNYCYTRDAVSGLLTVLAFGKSGQAYNVANESMHTTIGNMAELVAERIATPSIQVTFDIPETNIYGYADETHLFLSSDKLRKLGWQPEVGLEEAYRRMIASMKCEHKSGISSQ